MQIVKRSELPDDNNQNEDTNLKIDVSNDSNKNYKMFMIIRFTIILLGLAGVCLNTIYGFVLPHGKIECLLDRSFEATAGINKYLNDNVAARHLLIAFSSFCVDFVIIYMSFYWCFYAKSWRVVVALAVFYSFRGIIQVF
jgi:hypothetical protein